MPDGVGDDLGLVAVFLTSFLPFTFVNPSVEVVTDQFLSLIHISWNCRGLGATI